MPSELLTNNHPPTPLKDIVLFCLLSALGGYAFGYWQWTNDSMPFSERSVRHSDQNYPDTHNGRGRGSLGSTGSTGTLGEVK